MWVSRNIVVQIGPKRSYVLMYNCSNKCYRILMFIGPCIILIVEE